MDTPKTPRVGGCWKESDSTSTTRQESTDVKRVQPLPQTLTFCKSQQEKLAASWQQQVRHQEAVEPLPAAEQRSIIVSGSGQLTISNRCFWQWRKDVASLREEAERRVGAALPEDGSRSNLKTRGRAQDDHADYA